MLLLFVYKNKVYLFSHFSSSGPHLLLTFKINSLLVLFYLILSSSFSIFIDHPSFQPILHPAALGIFLKHRSAEQASSACLCSRVTSTWNVHSCFFLARCLALAGNSVLSKTSTEIFGLCQEVLDNYVHN